MARLVIKRVIVAVAALLAACAPSRAQEFPTRAVRIIIPLGPGGGGDVFTRALANELQKAWAQPVVVENRPGGGLNIGTRACADAVADGYTICVLSSEPIVFSQFLYKKIPYDPEKDFAPIANLFFNTLALVANSALHVKTLPELIALAKARPGTLSYATFSFPLAAFMEKLKRETGADLVRVPFRSGNEVVTALLSGATPVALLALSNMVPQVQSGRIVALAVNAKARSPLVPDVPTFAEAYGEDYAQTWFGLFAPAATPAPILEKIAADVSRIVGEPGFQRRMFVERAVEPAHERLADFARFIREDRKLAARIVAESGFQPE
jgi:tripartite-type tricarboxylate transporter receptor subunit TctC